MSKIYLKILVIIFISLFVEQNLFAQDFQKDLQKVTEKFNEFSFKMDITMKIYHWNSGSPTISSSGHVKKKGDDYYSNFDNRITLINKIYTVMITELDKNIIYMVNSKLGKRISNPVDILPDTNFIKNNVKLLSTKTQFKIYEVNDLKAGIKKMRIKISLKNELKEIRYYYDKMEQSTVKEVVISYSNIVFNPKFLTSDFSEKNTLKLFQEKKF
ncbi:MAG: hypothetical protein HRT73_12945 [Flavobacteriales bacterium]|nr:hypothetical protein [Flavobacteriales bacterium]